MKKNNVSAKTRFKNGKSYQWIADTYGEEFGLNHASSVRKVFMDGCMKLAKELSPILFPDKELTDDEIKTLAKSEYFQNYICEIMSEK